MSVNKNFPPQMTTNSNNVEKEKKHNQTFLGCLGETVINFIFLVIAIVCGLASILALVAGETFGEPKIIILGFAITLAYVLVILIIPYLRHNSFTRWIAFLGILDIGWWIYVIFIGK